MAQKSDVCSETRAECRIFCYNERKCRSTIYFDDFATLLIDSKQITGIEPASPAWEASVLPMNYICIVSLSEKFFNELIIAYPAEKSRRKEKPSGFPDGFPFLMRGEIVMSYQLSVPHYNVQMCSKYVHFLN